MASMLHRLATFDGKLASGTSASDLLRSSSNGISGMPLNDLGKARFRTSKRDLTISARIRKARKRDHPWPKDPDPNVKGGILRHLSPFKPLKEKPKPVILQFEKPLKDQEKMIYDIQKMEERTGLDFNDQLMAAENKYQKSLIYLYKNLTPIQRVQIARHPHRPTFLDHVFNITEKFVELHGDRAGYDDPAIVTGLGTINGKSYMFMGHQKGRNTKENIKRNFGMPTPHGYRKALRMMYYADHHGFPIVTFIDTPGAFADLKCEELGQGEAIAHNLRTMFGLKVPVISIVIGEGGSGGALAIGCANKLLMLENAVFYVASPEACASILWKSSKMAHRAAKKLKITAKELTKLQICDNIITEPLGGAHRDPEWTSEQIKNAIVEVMDELGKMEIPDLIQHRMAKFRKIGDYKHFPSQGPKITYDSANRSNPIIRKPKLKLPNTKALIECVPGLATKVELVLYLMKVKEREKETILQSSKAAKITGFNDKIIKLREEYNGVITYAVRGKLNDLTSEFWQMLCGSPNFKRIKLGLDKLRELAEDKRIKKTDGFMFEVTKKVDEILNRPDMKKKRDEVKSLMKELGVSNLDHEDLDQTLKDKIDQLDLQLATETNYLIPYHLLIELLKGSPEVNADKETVSYFKECSDFIDEFYKRPDITKKIKEAWRSKGSKKELKDARVLKQADEEKEDFTYRLGLRELLKKVKPDREVGKLMQELTEKFEEVINRPDVRKKNEFLKSFNKLRLAKRKDIDPVLKKKVVKAMTDIAVEFAKVLTSLGLEELLDEKLEVESLFKDEKEFKNGSAMKEKIAVGTDGVEIIAEANNRFA